MSVKGCAVLTFTLPAYWASYLINGDESGMSTPDLQACNAFLKENNLPPPVSCSDESWFQWSNDVTELAGMFSTLSFLFEFMKSDETKTWQAQYWDSDCECWEDMDHDGARGSNRFDVEQEARYEARKCAYPIKTRIIQAT
jgi:hypothetical protein